MKTKYFTVAILAILALSSCATESDVFDVEELNISQTGQTVEILNVTSVRIKSTSKEGVAVATAGGQTFAIVHILCLAKIKTKLPIPYWVQPQVAYSATPVEN